MTTVYEHQFKWQQPGADKLTPRKVLWIKPDSIDEFKLLEAINEGLRNKLGVHCGFTNDNSLIIYTFDT